MADSDRDVFALLTGGASSPEIGLIAYAQHAQNREDWIAHRHRISGTTPTPDEIAVWIRDIPDERFNEIQRNAVAYFDRAAQKYLSGDVERIKREALEAFVVAEINKANSLWRQLLMAITTAVVAPALIGGLIVAYLAYNQVFPTFIQVPTSSAQGRPNG